VRILGIDPGSRAAGWAVVEVGAKAVLTAAGVLRPPAALELHRRLAFLHDGLAEIVLRERPDEAAVEKIFAGVNPQSLITLGEARGVLLLALSRAGFEVHEVTPAEVKRAVAGNGNAEKEQVRRMVQAFLPGSRRLPLDAADAAAVALTAAWSSAGRLGRLRELPPARPEAPGARGGSIDWKKRPSG
jgi:crossover junction endodeoxyribonuclease RuvC